MPSRISNMRAFSRTRHNRCALSWFSDSCAPCVVRASDVGWIVGWLVGWSARNLRESYTLRTWPNTATISWTTALTCCMSTSDRSRSHQDTTSRPRSKSHTALLVIHRLLMSSKLHQLQLLVARTVLPRTHTHTHTNQARYLMQISLSSVAATPNSPIAHQPSTTAATVSC